MMALAGTGVAVITAAVAMSGMCKDAQPIHDNGPVKKQSKASKKKAAKKEARRKALEAQRRREAAAAAAEAEAELRAQQAPAKKKNKRKHKGKKRRGGGSKNRNSEDPGDDFQLKYATRIDDDEGLGEWASVSRSDKRRSRRRQASENEGDDANQRKEEEKPKRPQLPKIMMSLNGCAPAVIGRGGTTIQNIQAVTGTRLNIDKQMDMLEIIGTADQIAEAQAMVEAVLAKQEARAAGSDRARAHSVTVEVPEERLGSVIGKGGSTIRMIEAETGCRLDVKRETGAVHIGGESQDDIDRAERMVLDAIERPSPTLGPRIRVPLRAARVDDRARQRDGPHGHHRPRRRHNPADRGGDGAASALTRRPTPRSCAGTRPPCRRPSS